MTKKLRAVCYLFCVLLVTSLTSCDFSGINEAVEDFGIVVELESINTSATVLVKDAKSNKLITSEVEVVFNGPTGDQVIDIYSDPLPQRTINSGILNFGISNSILPSEESPAEVTLQLSAEGYFTTNRTVTIESGGSNQYSVEMIRKSDPPNGVEMSSNTDGQADMNGAVQQNYKVEAISEASSTSSSAAQTENTPYGVELEIPAGTVFKDIDGNPLTGQLTTDLTYYNPLEKDAMKSVPIDMKTIDGRRVLTFGMFSMEITDAKGKMAASVSSGSPRVTIKNGSSLPTVQGYLANGMVCIDVNFNSQCDEAEPMAMSRDSNGEISLTSLENKHDNPPVYVHSQDNLVLSAPANAKVVTPFSTLIQTIYEEQMESINGKNPLEDKPDIVAGKILSESEHQIDISNTDNVGSITVELSTPGFAAEKIANTSRIINNAIRNIHFSDLPKGDLDFEIRAAQANEIIRGNHNFHTDGKLEINLPDLPSNYISATVKVALSCENSGQKVAVTNIPNASVFYQREDADSGDWSEVKNLDWHYDEENQELTGGSFDIVGVELGADYTFSITYETTTYERDITIDGENITYTETVSDGVCR